MSWSTGSSARIVPVSQPIDRPCPLATSNESDAEDTSDPLGGALESKEEGGTSLLAIFRFLRYRRGRH